MIRLLADEHIPPALVNGLRLQMIGIEILTTSDVGLNNTADAEILAWAAENDYVLLTMDAKTMLEFAFDRIRSQRAMPGIIIVHHGHTLRKLLDDLELTLTCFTKEDFGNQVVHLPLP